MCRHLPSDADNRNGVHQRIGETSDGIRSARPRCHQHDANLPRRARIPFGRMHGTALLAHQDMLHGLLLKHLVVNRQHRAARIPEHMLNALIGERLEHHFSSGHGSCHSCPPFGRPIAAVRLLTDNHPVHPPIVMRALNHPDTPGIAASEPTARIVCCRHQNVEMRTAQRTSQRKLIQGAKIPNIISQKSISTKSYIFSAK